jgi:hypothetical protein
MKNVYLFICVIILSIGCVYALKIDPPDTVKGHHETDFWGSSTGTVFCDGTGELTCYYTKPSPVRD